MGVEEVYHCRTEEDAISFLTVCYSKGYTWWMLIEKDSNPIKWKKYGSETCYRLDHEHKKIFYADKRYYEDKDLKIVQYSGVSPYKIGLVELYPLS